MGRSQRKSSSRHRPRKPKNASPRSTPTVMARPTWQRSASSASACAKARAVVPVVKARLRDKAACVVQVVKAARADSVAHRAVKADHLQVALPKQAQAVSAHQAVPEAPVAMHLKAARRRNARRTGRLDGYQPDELFAKMDKNTMAASTSRSSANHRRRRSKAVSRRWMKTPTAK